MTKFNVAFMIKVVENAGPKETYLNTIKSMCEKPTANITLNGNMLGTVPLKSGPTQRFPLFTLLFNIMLKVLVGAKRQGKGIKGKQTGKESVPL